ncbi:MAG: carboxypeptidase-like regulatory domain-containing protein [Acidobacteriota bacterium]
MKLKFLFGTLFLFLLTGSGPAQSSNAEQSGIRGEVVNYELGAIIIAAKITISAKSFRREIRTDSNGYYEIRLPADSYLVEIEALGFRKVQRKKLKIDGKGLFTYNVNMGVDKSQTVNQEHP